MSDEIQQRAVEYLLGELEAPDAARFEAELETITERARANGLAADPVYRQRLADAWITLRVMRFHALRTLPLLESGAVSPATSIGKLLWSTFHRDLGELAMAVIGADSLVGEGRPDGAYELQPLQRLFLFSRAETIHSGSSEIQRNVIGEQALGLPREPKVAP